MQVKEKAPVRRKQTLEQSLATIRGGEPFTRKNDFRPSLMRALNWYAANWDEKDYRRSAVHYVVTTLKMKEAAYALNKATFLEIRPIGALGRLIERNQYLDLNSLEKLFVIIEELKNKYPKQKAVVEKVEAQPVVEVPAATIQERILETARNLAADVDGAVDEFCTKGTEFSMKGFLASNQVSGVVAKKIGSLYESQLKELDEAVKGTDKQLKEAYGHRTKRNLKQIADFVRQIIADCNQQVVTAKAQRKPRVSKPKPPAMIVKKLQYKKEFETLNLKSISAEKILGASELWVYNTVSRKMTVFYGADSSGLGVSGTSITNYDVAKSETKTIRKPEEYFKDLSPGKRAMAASWKKITTKPAVARSRINDEVILFCVN